MEKQIIKPERGDIGGTDQIGGGGGTGPYGDGGDDEI